jgi:hypothetical protein
MATMPETIVNVVTVKGAKLELKEGDTLAVMYPNRLAKDQVEHLMAYLRPALPEGVKVMVLDGGMTLAKISENSKPATPNEEEIKALIADGVRQGTAQLIDDLQRRGAI